MDQEEQMVLDNIEEFLNDDGKIVTYKFLSLTLSLHVNKSKHLLEEYLKGKKEEEFEVVYFIGGIKQIGSEKTYRYTLVKRDSLEDIKGKFDTVTTCHIYSIQKSKLKNFDVLYSTDCDLVKQSIHDLHNYSEIQCNFTRRESTLPIVQPVKANGFHETKKETPKLPSVNQAATDKKVEGKETQAALFFGSKSTKSAEKKEGKAENKQAKKPAKKEAKQPSGIANAFSKSKPAKKPVEKQETAKEEENVEEDKKETKVEELNIEKETPKKEDEKTKQKSKKRKVEIQGSDDDEDFENFLARTKKGSSKDKTEKKKQIIKSDDEDEDVDVVAPTPEPVKKPKSKRRKKDVTDIDPSPSNENPKEMKEDSEAIEKEVEKEPEPAAKEDQPVTEETTAPVKRRKRRRVMKSKQFIDDDGFMVTKKVYESESYSEESENEEEKKKTRQKEEEKQKVSKQLDSMTKPQTKAKKKQTSMSSFFKKL